MGFRFECDCGGTVSRQTPGANPEVSESVFCEGCGADYAITITALGSNENERFVKQFGVEST